MNPTGSLDSKYEVLGKIREGGMGAIFKVRHRLLNQIRVIKVMRPQVSDSADSRRRFLREAQVATRLSHPNIVTFYDFALDDDEAAYMVMEYIDGVSLSDLIGASGPLPLSLAARLGEEGLSALEYLHRRQIVHRDISPDNVMLAIDDDGGVRTKLIDLGIARTMSTGQERLTVTGEFVGKLRYASPEQIEHAGDEAALDARSDLYSFGATLYEAITGRTPFQAGGLGALLRAHASGSFLSFDESDPAGRVGPRLRASFAKALAPDPTRRFQSAADFSKALVDAVASQADSDEKRPWTACLSRRPVHVPTETGQSGKGAFQGALDEEFPGTRPRPPELTERDAPDPQDGQGVPHSTGQVAGSTRLETLVHRNPQAGTEVYRRPATPATAEAASSTRVGTRRRWGILLAGVGVAIAGSLAVRELRPREASSPPALSILPKHPTPQIIRFEDSDRVRSSMSSGTPAETGSDPAASMLAPHRSDEGRERTASPSLGGATRAVASTAIADPVPPATIPIAPVRDPIRYCPLLDRTAYSQGTISEKPEGFAEDSAAAFAAPRPDAGRVEIDVRVHPSEPLEGEVVEIVARVVNGGDMPLDVSRIEEMRSRQGFAAVEGSRVPASVDIGGVLEVYRTRFTLTPGSTYIKDLRIVDGAGDIWRTSVRLVPCSPK